MTQLPPCDRYLPTGWPGQLLAVGLAILAVAIVSGGIVGPLLDRYAEAATDLADRRAAAQRFETLAADLPIWQDRARALAARMPAASALLQGDSDAVAAAAVQASVQAMLADLGASLASVEALGADDVGIHRRIRVRLSFLTSWTGLVQLLERLSVATPILLIDELEITPARHRIGVKPGALDVSCTVVAFRSVIQRSGPP